ncbi:DUF4876 domain-containing protein [Sphingobacterium olei]|uniref:DUF4876 domain-containing protein n=1 Tax=Sphingobacterium olei TaxID=2571155 RepID=A0A4U0NP07_9SPHI|nr:DUF4876 domain-containing protein [Sphingobacterium olei]TJZ51834.1 DUF4876 domain-containing protein [Sphingobacterium olei]
MKSHKFSQIIPLTAIFIFAVFSLLFVTSCKDDDDVALQYEVAVTVNYPEGYAESLASGIAVTATNTLSGANHSATTGTDGVANFRLSSGVYNFTAVGETEEFAFNGNLSNITIAENGSRTITLTAAALGGGLVIKEFYYTGSKTPEGGNYFSDQFLELYNNSDEVIYLDGIGIGGLTPTTSWSPSVWVDAAGNLQSRLPVQNYTAVFPGNGTQHPLQPRTSVVIAQDGINHKSDPAGNPNSPVNLGNADWEYYVGDLNGGRDADAAGVPNLKVIYTTTTTFVDQLYSVFGAAIIVFKLPEGTTPEAYVESAANFSTQPGASATTQYLLINKEYVLDAVEFVDTDPSRRYKRMPADLDAGYAYDPTGTYSAKSTRRKVKQIIDGKAIYKDTNNSTEDFLSGQTPSPKVHSTVVEP